MIHITCLAHGLHRVTETVHILNPKIDRIIVNIKKCLEKFCLAFKLSKICPFITTST